MGVKSVLNIPFFDVFMYFVILLLTLYYFSVKTFSHWKNLGIKFAKPVPFFGNTMLTNFRKKSPPVNQQDIYNMFPEEKLVGMFMFRTPLLMVKDPFLVHLILTNDFSHFYDRGINVDERVDLLSLHLVNLKGQRWKSLRNKLTPAFSSGKLKLMSFQLGECANTLSDYLNEVALSGESHDMREVMAKFATDVIGSCAFGLQFNTLKDPDSQFRKMGQRVFNPSLRFLLKFIARTIHKNLPYLLNLKALPLEVETFFLDFVKNAINEREEKKIERKDFIQILIDKRKEDLMSGSKEDSFILTDQVVASNAFVFFLAGFETTSSTMSFMLLELATNPDIQDKVRQEIVSTLAKHGNELNYDTIKDLPYLEMVISETLRKYPIATAVLRECNQDYLIPDTSIVLKKETKVLIPVYALHRDPNYFPDPEKFDPERFSPENKPKIQQGTYLPFGDGPRICIGLRFAMMEMKYAFCKIIPKYRFSLSPRMKYPVVFKKGAPLLAPEDGVWLDVGLIS